MREIDINLRRSTHIPAESTTGRKAVWGEQFEGRWMFAAHLENAMRREIKVEGGLFSEQCFDAKAEKCRRVPDSWGSQALDRWLCNRTTDKKKNTQANFPKPAVYTGARMLETFRGSPK